MLDDLLDLIRGIVPSLPVMCEHSKYTAKAKISEG